MKINSLILLVTTSIILLVGCDEKVQENDFIISSDNPASALTIGWYAPPDIVKEIVGTTFTPKIVNDKNETSIILFVVKSDEHLLDGFASGPMESAHLFIPVEKSEEIKTKSGINITNTLVCPITIVDQSQRLGNKYNDFGFPTYFGDIELNIRKTGEKYMVEAKIKTANGLIEINSMFEEEEVEKSLTSAIFTSKPGMRSFFYGEERFKRISNGKGNLKTDGQNIISAMNLNGQPYYLKLDLDITWEFDFARE